MISFRRFRLYDRLGAWGVFVVALLTYMLTLEPTASYWDCPEYIAVADKMQIGHSPGNPMWMLAARFFIDFSPDATHKALLVNAMSGMFSAFAVMLLYRTVPLLLLYARFGSRRSMEEAGGLERTTVILVTGCGLAGALALCWSDSFWFSAVEAEVYAFSIFMTALTLWVTLRWAFAEYGTPHADRWLILAAYLTGAGMGVHELNLLCVPAMALVVWHRIARGHRRTWRSWAALAAGCLAVIVILFLCVPGFLRFASSLELWTVNRMHLPFNSGFVAAWAVVFVLLWGGGVVLTVIRKGGRAVRVARLTMWCSALFFTGFSCYALIVIRGAANPPLNTGAPGNVFNFSRYYSREQYGSSPLLRGPAFGAPRLRVEHTDTAGKKTYRHYYNTAPAPRYVAARYGDKATLRNGFATGADSLQAAADSRRRDDFYILTDFDFTIAKVPEMTMWLPRMYSDNPDDISGYYSWAGMSREDMVMIPHPTLAVDPSGRPVAAPDLPADTLYRPTYMQNLAYLAAYQTGFMYMRYFLWNFVGRQNDYPGHGEPDCGLPATGIEPLDRQWSGPTSLMPAEASRDNPGHNIYFFLPLLLGLAGMLWQIQRPGADRRCAAVVAALFFFTGIAIVLYLNQPPTQARDRDYAFLGSYYAFCIWIGMGVMPLYGLARRLFRRRNGYAAVAAVAVALIVPLQMLSRNCDDHDRSGRTATSDLAYNVLAPLPEGAVIFVDGDNSTFPLWYMQSTEGVRRDVRIVSLTYLSDPDYASSLSLPVWDAAPLRFSMPDSHLRMGRFVYAALPSDSTWTDASEVLRRLYDTQSAAGFPRLSTSRVYIPFPTSDTLRIDLRRCSAAGGIVRQDLLLLLDIIAANASSPKPRPFYWITNSGDGVFNGQLAEAFRKEGSVSRLAPGHTTPDHDKVFDDVMRLYRWGGADSPNAPYYDPLAASRMSEMRREIIAHASAMSADSSRAAKALLLIDKIQRSMPASAVAYRAYMLPDSTFTDEGTEMALAMWRASHASPTPSVTRRRALDMLRARLHTAEQWNAYRAALPEAWRQYLSDPHGAAADEVPRLRHLLDSLTLRL